MTFVDGWSAVVLLAGRILVVGTLIVTVRGAVQFYGTSRQLRRTGVGALASAVVFTQFLATANQATDREVAARTATDRRSDANDPLLEGLNKAPEAEKTAEQATENVVNELDRLQVLFGDGEVLSSADAAAGAAGRRSDERYFERDAVSKRAAAQTSFIEYQEAAAGALDVAAARVRGISFPDDPTWPQVLARLAATNASRRESSQRRQRKSASQDGAGDATTNLPVAVAS